MGITCVAACVCLNAPETLAEVAEARVHVEVPHGAWRSVRVEKIPRGTVLSVEVVSDGRVAVLLLGADDYARFPSGERPLFQGSTRDRISASVRAPARGDYYVLVDNRAGSEPRSVDVAIRGDTGERHPSGDASGEAHDASGDARDAPDAGSAADGKTQLGEVPEQLAKLFVFESFPVRLETCGKAQAFSDASGVVVCREYAERLQASLGDEAKARDALLFTLFHEIGHVLLEQWRYPTYANEETADEFAAALLVMLGQRERLAAQAELFEANASVLEAIARSLSDDRHPLSAQRARNLRRWSADEVLVRRWQPLFVPHMRTPLLERLQRAPTPWTDLALVHRELEVRAASR